MPNLSSRYVYSLFEDLKDHEILMCYFGNVSFKISNHLINTLKENLDSDKIERVIFKKVYSSFVECIENITRHTSEDKKSGDPHHRRSQSAPELSQLGSAQHSRV